MILQSIFYKVDLYLSRVSYAEWKIILTTHVSDTRVCAKQFDDYLKIGKTFREMAFLFICYSIIIS